MCNFTRREILRILSMAFPATLLGCSCKDHFEDERVCIHIFNSTISLPQPLLERPKNIPARSERGSFFQIGIPELILCTATTSFLDLFQYFWPITRKEFEQWRGLISVMFNKSEITGQKDIDELTRYLQEQKISIRSKSMKMALVLTFNDYTKYWIAHLIETWRNAGIDEFVIFKDPTRAPYLCDYPSLQKGFKRPPP